MQFYNKLIPATLIKRYKRFLADVILMDGQIITVYCPNPGAMLGLMTENSRAWLSLASEGHRRKYPYTWEIIEADNTLVGINTQHPNTIVAEALINKKIPELAHYGHIQREVKYAGHSRVDFYLTGDGLAPCYLEIKNVHLKRGEFAEFPDCVTERGVKHLQALSHMVNQGARAVVLYIVQRQDCKAFGIASDIDAKYAINHHVAIANGVEQLCYQCTVSLHEITLDQPMRIINKRQFE